MNKKLLSTAGLILLSVLIIGFIANLISEGKRNRTYSYIPSKPTSTVSIPSDWIQYEIGESYKLSLPETMELRHDYDEYTRWLADGLGYISKAEAVFQQKELSNFSSESMQTYARIMVQRFPCDPGETEHHYEYPSLTDADYTFLDEMVMAEVAPSTLIDVPSWSVVIIGENKAIEGRYRRTGFEGPVNCKIYLFSNFDEIVKMIVSYREKDKEFWAKDLDKVIYSFKWKYPK